MLGEGGGLDSALGSAKVISGGSGILDSHIYIDKPLSICLHDHVRNIMQVLGHKV